METKIVPLNDSGSKLAVFASDGDTKEFLKVLDLENGSKVSLDCCETEILDNIIGEIVINTHKHKITQKAKQIVDYIENLNTRQHKDIFKSLYCYKKDIINSMQKIKTEENSYKFKNDDGIYEVFKDGTILFNGNKY